MALTLVLRGALDACAAEAEVATWLDDVESWLRERFGHLLMGLVRSVDVLGAPDLLVRMHPAAPGLELVVRVVQNGGGPRVDVVARARTDQVGAGYHHFVCELLRDLGGARGIQWDPRTIEDPSSYFFSRDLDALDRHLDGLRRAAAAEALDLARPVDWTGLPWVRFAGREAVHTVLGPRDAAWLTDVASGRRDGRDIVPWPEPGEDETTAHGRLLCLFWLEARLRAPLSEEEAATLAEMARLIRFLEDLGEEVPKDLRADLVDVLQEVPVEALRSGGGYWTRASRLVLPGGFELALPPDMGVSWQDNASVLLRQGSASLWWSVLTGDDAAAVEDIVGDPDLSRAEGPLVANAAIVEQEERDESGGFLRYHVLDGRAQIGAHLLVASLCFDDAAGEALALELWRGLGWRAP